MEYTELTPEEMRLWNYANNLMYANFKADNEAGVTRFLNDPAIKDKFNDDQRTTLMQFWLLITGLDDEAYSVKTGPEKFDAAEDYEDYEDYEDDEEEDQNSHDSIKAL
jgi:hypothetical protein